MKPIKIKQEKTNKTNFLLLIGVLFVVFMCVFFIITLPSKESNSKKGMLTSSDKNEGKGIFEKNKDKLIENEVGYNTFDSIEIQHVIQNNVHLFINNDSLISDNQKNLPKALTNGHLIFDDELSRRIFDTMNYPNKMYNDIFVLNAIWKSYSEDKILQQTIKDKFLVEEKDINLAKNQFDSIVKKIQIDSSLNRKNENRQLRVDVKESHFGASLKKIYKTAKNSPIGSIYSSYIKKHVINQLKNSTFFDSFVRKMISTSDAYLDPVTAYKIKVHLNSIIKK
jgi:hypothetical protein